MSGHRVYPNNNDSDKIHSSYSALGKCIVLNIAL